MNRPFSELFNMLLERYHFAANGGYVSEVTARRTLAFGLKNAVNLAYNCEDIGSAMVLQNHLEQLKDQQLIPKPI